MYQFGISGNFDSPLKPLGNLYCSGNTVRQAIRPAKKYVVKSGPEDYLPATIQQTNSP